MLNCRADAKERTGGAKSKVRVLLKYSALIVAAGRGQRASRDGKAPKQYAELGRQTVLAHALAPFLAHDCIASVTVVIHADDRDLYEAAVAPLSTAPGRARLRTPVIGGATRQDSVYAGLQSLASEEPHGVLIHDAARPFVDEGVLDRVLGSLATLPGAIAAEPLADTLKREGTGSLIAGTVDRSGLWRAQTPQGFHFKRILAAHRKAADKGRHDFTDDAALAEWDGIPVALVPGSSRNTKITTLSDLELANLIMSETMPAPALEPRFGTGFDVHRFEPGDHVWLCGVRIPHDAKLEGHSDADAPLHALTDAILGALGDGDIGQHFPPSDPKWKGAASRLFVEDARNRVEARGGRILNVDVTILCEAPRIGPHRDAMRAAIADMLKIDPSRVAVKATTTETLGFTGRKEGLAALASAALMVPG